LLGVGVAEDEVPGGPEDDSGGEGGHGGGEEPGDNDREDASIRRPDLECCSLGW
jgi:hypothetical protein